jgi:hypothetical protein
MKLEIGGLECFEAVSSSQANSRHNADTVLRSLAK